jgi:hypothetical protein
MVGILDCLGHCEEVSETRRGGGGLRFSAVHPAAAQLTPDDDDMWRWRKAPATSVAGVAEPLSGMKERRRPL